MKIFVTVALPRSNSAVRSAYFSDAEDAARHLAHLEQWSAQFNARCVYLTSFRARRLADGLQVFADGDGDRVTVYGQRGSLEVASGTILGADGIAGEARARIGRLLLAAR